MTDDIPQTIPNIVRKIRILCARKVAIVWRKISSRLMVAPSLGDLTSYLFPSLRRTPGGLVMFHRTIRRGPGKCSFEGCFEMGRLLFGVSFLAILDSEPGAK